MYTEKKKESQNGSPTRRAVWSSVTQLSMELHFAKTVPLGVLNYGQPNSTPRVPRDAVSAPFFLSVANNFLSPFWGPSVAFAMWGMQCIFPCPRQTSCVGFLDAVVTISPHIIRKHTSYNFAFELPYNYFLLLQIILFHPVQCISSI